MINELFVALFNVVMVGVVVPLGVILLVELFKENAQ